MNDPLGSAFLDDPEFQLLIADCIEALQRGETIDRKVLRKKFPRYANELDGCVDALCALDDFAGRFRQSKSSDASGRSAALGDATSTPLSATSDFETGDKIRYIGEYEVLEEISRGGMGVVFKARQQKLNRIVALKMILSGRMADTIEVERFRREAQAASRLNHPNIVSVHEIGEHDGRQYFTMDYIAGQSLDEAIREQSLAPRHAAALVKTVAEAVSYAHKQGTLHRDLKPANVLMTSDGTPHITDFGLAKILDQIDESTRVQLTASGQIMGTPSYMSPEQATGKRDLVGPATDIYSLGAVLYACLTARAPCIADTPVDTLIHVIYREPISPRQLNPIVPKDLETVCLKCLSKQPHKRYDTAQELADELGRFLGGHPVLARPVGPVARALSWTKRNVLVASLLALVVFSLSAATTVSAYFAVSANQRAVAQRQATERQVELVAETEDLAAELKQSLTRETKLKRDAIAAKSLAEQRLTISQRALFAMQLSRSYELWAENPVEALQGLRNKKHCPPELQDFCWRFVHGLSDRFVREYPGHQSPRCLDVSPDGELIASCFLRQNILVVSRDSGKSWAMKETPEKWVRRVAFLPSGQTLLSAGNDQQVTAWNARTGERLYSLHHGENIAALAVSPDGRWVAAGGKQATRIWRTADREMFRTSPHGSQELAFTSDGQTLVAARGSQIILDKLEVDKTTAWDAQQNRITGLDVSPDGTLALVSDANTVSLRELATGLVRQRIEEPLKNANFTGVKFSPDGQTFATTSGNYPIKLWSVESGRLIGVVAPYDGSTHAVEFMRDGAHIVTPAEHDKSNMKLWKIPRTNPAETIRHQALWMATCTQNNCLATTDQSKIDIWDFRTGEVVRSWTPSESEGVAGPVAKLLFIPGETDLFSMHLGKDGGVVAQWSSETGRLVRRFENLGRGKTIAFDATHRRVAVPNKENMVSLRDFETGEEIDLLSPYHNELQCAEFSRDGNWLAYGDGWDPLPDGTPVGSLRLCNLQTGEATVLTGHEEFGIYDLAFAPDGQTLVSVGDGGILWDVATGTLRARLHGHQSAVVSVDFSPDGKTIATGGMDATVRLWDTVTGEQRLALRGHPSWVTSVEFSADGTRLASSSFDGEMKFWDAGRASRAIANVFIHSAKVTLRTRAARGVASIEIE